MKRPIRYLVSLLLILLMTCSMAQAEPAESYGQTVGRKLLNGLGNITTGIAEVPKNVIIVSNESNFAYGFVGGTFKGLIVTAGRMGVGLLDLITAPIPTYPIVYPAYVWDDFYADTTFGPALVGQQPR